MRYAHTDAKTETVGKRTKNVLNNKPQSGVLPQVVLRNKALDPLSLFASVE